MCHQLIHPGLGQISLNDPRAQAAGLFSQSSFFPAPSGSPILPPGEFLSFTGTGMGMTGSGVPVDARTAQLQGSAALAAARLGGGRFGGHLHPGPGS